MARNFANSDSLSMRTGRVAAAAHKMNFGNCHLRRSSKPPAAGECKDRNMTKIEEVMLTIGKGYLIMLVTGIGQMFDGEKNNRRTGEIYEYL